MTSENLTKAFATLMETFLNTHVLPAISTGLKSKGYTVSVSELSGMLTNSSTKAPLEPLGTIPTTVGTATTKVTKARGPRKTKQASPVNQDANRCYYVKTKGSGDRCTGKIDPAHGYFCETCSKKSTAQNQLEKIKQQLSGQSKPINESTSTTNAKTQMAVITIGKGLHKDPMTGLVLRSTGIPNSYVCIGYQKDMDSDIVPLDEDQIKECKKKGYDYVDPSSEVKTPSLPTVTMGQPVVAPVFNGMPPATLPTALPSKLPSLDIGIKIPKYTPVDEAGPSNAVDEVEDDDILSEDDE